MTSRRWSPTVAPDPILDAIPPASGAVVMGTGIVSIALTLDSHETLSVVLLVLAAAAWVTLAVLLPARALRDRPRFRDDVRLPAAFTSVAGTAVLGTRLTLLGWTGAAGALLAIAFAVWLGLIGTVLRNWRTPTVGASFILTVGTESLALLAAALALADHAGWLLGASLPPFVLGLGFYAFVLRHFDRTQLATGRGDHWVTGGALAISTVAAGRITLAAEHLRVLHDAVGTLKVVSLVLWVLALAWLPALIFAEARWPRRGYYVRRWSTVFPVGMYAACSFVVGDIDSAPAITSFARVWIWIAVAVWGVVACGLARAATRAIGEALRHQSGPRPASGAHP
ncbi:MAG: tellurite resistance/C4-dicarboxylate transporter family protein [Solirubrobacteraceae bacterium]